MKLLMTADTVGGVWTYALELAEALRPRGVEVTIAAMGGLPDAGQRAEAQRRGLTVQARAYRLEWMPDAWADVDRAGRWLMDLADALEPDVVQLNNFAHVTLPWGAPTVLVAHSDVVTWWRSVHGEAPPASWGFYREMVNAALHHADAVVAPTAAYLRELDGPYQVPPDAGAIHNARSPRLFSPGVKRRRILAAGRAWDRAKNLATLDEAARGLPWEVRIAGAAETPGTLGPAFFYARALGQLTQPDLATQLAAASIYCLPARYEPFGLSVLEAAFSGCALVLGDRPTLREVWGDAAVYVDPDDATALRRALRALVEDPPRRRQLAGAARRRAARYTPARMARAYVELYRRLLGGDPARTREDPAEGVLS